MSLAERAQQMLATMPPYEADDEFIQDLMNAVGMELQRVQDYLDEIIVKLRPQNADDTYGILALYEALAGLPVEPEVSLTARQARVLASRQRGRSLGIGEGWAALISLLLNSEAWMEEEAVPAANEITITVPYPSTSFQAGALEALLSRITGAGIRLHIIYLDTFIVGTSEVGDSL